MIPINEALSLQLYISAKKKCCTELQRYFGQSIDGPSTDRLINKLKSKIKLGRGEHSEDTWLGLISIQLFDTTLF